MAKTYKAVEVSAPGVLRVRIRVEACGICHTDSATVIGAYPGLKLPRVPGREVVGRFVGDLLELEHNNFWIRPQSQGRAPRSCSARGENLHVPDSA
jgi:Alcohol dehydrogenase GroES-like domain